MELNPDNRVLALKVSISLVVSLPAACSGSVLLFACPRQRLSYSSTLLAILRLCVSGSQKDPLDLCYERVSVRKRVSIFLGIDGVGAIP